MAYGLSLARVPIWMDSSFRYFEKHERHVSRRLNFMCALIIVFDGVLRFHENGVPIEVSAGEYYIQQYGTVHEGIEESDSPKYFYIHFKNATFQEGKDVLPIRGKVDFSDLNLMMKELDALHNTNATMVEITTAFYKILTELYKMQFCKTGSEIVNRVINLATADIRKSFSLEAIAKSCGYSKSQIINIFKKEIGKTPYAYVNEIKLNRAKQLLLHSESSYSSIAVECGFGSYTNLYRCFVREVGCSPAAWKQTNRTLQLNEF